MKKLVLFCCLLFAYANGFEENFSCASQRSNCTQLGISGFAGNPQNEFYTVKTHSFPDAVPLSKKRNAGSTQGQVQLTDKGLKILCPGNYSVNVQAILVNREINYGAIIQVFLVEDNKFIPNKSNGNIVLLPAAPPNEFTIGPVTFNAILENVTPGTTLSLVATNGGSPNPQPIDVIAWGINAFRIN